MAKEPIAGEKKIITDIIEKKSKIQKMRNLYEKSWLVNIAFLYGKQHFIAESRKVVTGIEERILWELKSEERKNKVKRASNYILPLYRSLLARLLMMKAHITAEPTTSTQEDKSAAKVSQELLEDFWQMVNKNNAQLCRSTGGMPLVLSKAFKFMLATGRGYLKPYFNPKTISKTVLDGEVIEGEIGEVECKVLSQFDIFEDKLGRYLIEQSVMPVDKIKSLYGVKVEPDSLTISETEQQLLNMLEGGSEDDARYEDSARVYEYWEMPSNEYHQGRYVITTDGKLITDSVIPTEYKGRMPYFSLDYMDFMLTGFPQGMVDQLVSLQEDYNYTLTRIHAYKKWFAGKLKIPKKCKLETKYDDEIGQIIYYESGYGEPHFEVPPNPPTFLTEELARIRRDMEDVAGVHDSAMGRQPQQIKSGIAIENLNELDNTQLSPVLMGLEQQISFFAETVLDIISEKYVEPRILSITGENLVHDVATFMGKDVTGNRRIKINMGSALPMSRSERQNFLIMMAEKGFIDRAKALELMEFGDLAGVYVSVDENAQKTEIGEMMKGVQVVPNQYDYHSAHLKIVEDFLKGEAFKKLPPELQQIFLQHYQIHQKFLQQEMQAASQMQGQPQGA